MESDILSASAYNPTVFISYSWDSKSHQTWVRSLAERLVRNGIQVSLDLWDVAPGESLVHFMEEAVDHCDFTIVVCTPMYAKKSNTRTGGVGYEQQIISGKLLTGTRRKKFIPLLRSGSYGDGAECGIPNHFLGMRALNFSQKDDQDHDFEDLIRTIFGEPRYVPPSLGQRPDFIAATFDSDENVRLPDIELDGYTIWSGVVSNERSPDTFQIPTATERNSLKAKDIVKIGFGISMNNTLDDVEGERMWVEIDCRKGPYFLGKLKNVPLDSGEEGAPLHFGDEVVFLPEHVIDIITREEREKQ